MHLLSQAFLRHQELSFTFTFRRMNHPRLSPLPSGGRTLLDHSHVARMVGCSMTQCSMRRNTGSIPLFIDGHANTFWKKSHNSVTVEHVNRLALLQTRHYLSWKRQAQSLLGAGMVRMGRPRYRPVTYATERATDTTTKTRIYSNAIMSLLNEPAALPKAYRLHLVSVLVCLYQSKSGYEWLNLATTSDNFKPMV